MDLLATGEQTGWATAVQAPAWQPDDTLHAAANGARAFDKPAFLYCNQPIDRNFNTVHLRCCRAASYKGAVLQLQGTPMRPPA